MDGLTFNTKVKLNLTKTIKINPQFSSEDWGLIFDEQKAIILNRYLRWFVNTNHSLAQIRAEMFALMEEHNVANPITLQFLENVLYEIYR